EAEMEGQSGLEGASPRTDEMEADVRRHIAGSLLTQRRARPLDRPQGHSHLGLAARLREILHRMSVAVTAGKIHPRIDAGRIPPQDLLHRADALHEAAPVECATESQAGHRV